MVCFNVKKDIDIKKIVLVIVFNIFLVILLTEIIGIIYYYAKTGKVFYTRFHGSTPISSQKSNDIKHLTAVNSAINSILHPYWGFITRPGLTLKEFLPRERIDLLVGEGVTPDWINLSANEYGFYSDVSYPYIPKKDEFIIGIFGGSVAHWFKLQGSQKLIEHLSQYQLFHNKKIKIISFAQGGFKQPQQLQILSYFLAIGQHFDFVINIDGFNEVALSNINYGNNVDISMPSSQHLLPIINVINKSDINVERLTALLNIAKSKQSLQYIRNFSDKNYSAGLNLLLSLMIIVKDREYQAAVISGEALNKTSTTDYSATIYQINKLPHDMTSTNEFELISRLWADCSILSKQLLASQHIPYLHVLQPNQYYCQRSFNEDELFAVDTASPYKIGVEKGYPLLLKQIDKLQKNNVHFMNLIDFFDQVPKRIYSDSCCHYNQLGNELLAIRIAEKMHKMID